MDMPHHLFRLLPIVCATAIASGQTSTITGTVIDSTSRQPVSAATVQLAGSGRGTMTASDGTYRLNAVALGRTTLRVTRLGFAAVTRAVVVADGGGTVADFVLTPTQVTLDQVIVTATGQTERERENGSTVATIGVDSVSKAAVGTFSDLVAGKAAGVEVAQSSGEVGSGARIRIRGSNSVSLPNDPLLIIDGVRVSNDAASMSTDINTGGQTPSRFDDLNPDDIESVEILKGPAASALYGTAGANGVLMVTTKKGVNGHARWATHADYGSVANVATFPANFGQVGFASGQRVTSCTLIDQGTHACTKRADSLLSFNPLESRFAPFSTGNTRKLAGLSVSGGTDQVRYYVSGDYDDTHGIYPNNFATHNNGRANLAASPGSTVDLGISAGYVQGRLQLPQNDNDSFSPLGSALFGSPIDGPTHGYAFLVPAVSNSLIAAQNIERFTGATNGDWRPLSWLQLTGVAGVDFTSRVDQQLYPAGIIPVGFSRLAATGRAASDAFQIWTYTAQLTTTATYHLAPSLRATSSVGTQYINEVERGTQASGYGLAAGTGSVGAATTNFAASQLANQQIVTIGYYAQQQVAWHDRLFLTGALRADDNSTFGHAFAPQLYPSISGSWVIGEESWFPRSAALSSLRLRAAFGYSGQHPGFQQAQTFYTTVAYRYQNADVGAVTLGGIGNPQLKPERSGELETGLDAGFFHDRVTLQGTFYSKTTTDALVAINLPPSVGGITVGPAAGTSTRFANLGEVTNRGVEALLTATLLNGKAARIDVSLNGSFNTNKLVTLGSGVAPILFGASSISGAFIQQQRAGYPLGGYWQPAYTYRDANHDGIIEPSEVTVATASSYRGAPFPKEEIGINPTVVLLHYFRLSALFDFHGTVALFNQTNQFRCSVIYPFTNCQADYDPRTALAAQAAVAADAQGTDAGYIENATFWKWRELSIKATAPDPWSRFLHLSGLSFTLAGRNLHTWTRYTGLDPEVTFNGQSNFATAEFLTQPMLQYWTGRVEITF